MKRVDLSAGGSHPVPDPPLGVALIRDHAALDDGCLFQQQLVQTASTIESAGHEHQNGQREELSRARCRHSIEQPRDRPVTHEERKRDERKNLAGDQRKRRP